MLFDGNQGAAVLGMAEKRVKDFSDRVGKCRDVLGETIVVVGNHHQFHLHSEARQLLSRLQNPP